MEVNVSSCIVSERKSTAVDTHASIGIINRSRIFTFQVGKQERKAVGLLISSSITTQPTPFIKLVNAVTDYANGDVIG